jgi:hypothetical protein
VKGNIGQTFGYRAGCTKTRLIRHQIEEGLTTSPKSTLKSAGIVARNWPDLLSRSFRRKKIDWGANRTVAGRALLRGNTFLIPATMLECLRMSPRRPPEHMCSSACANLLS